MAFFGYSSQVVNEYGLHELSEVSVEVSAADLRILARFLNDCANKIETGTWRSNHCHISTYDRMWDSTHPNSDFIVLHNSPQPPGVYA